MKTSNTKLGNGNSNNENLTYFRGEKVANAPCPPPLGSATVQNISLRFSTRREKQNPGSSGLPTLMHFKDFKGGATLITSYNWGVPM